MGKYVLQDTMATDKRGKPVYFKQMTGIGPMYTESLDEAEKFEVKEDAMHCPAFYHPLCFFEPVEINAPTTDD